MSNHVTEWLNAYLDGELHGSRLQHVEAHLAECDACQAELESLERLSSLLQKSLPRSSLRQNGLRLRSACACPAKKQKLPEKRFSRLAGG